MNASGRAGTAKTVSLAQVSPPRLLFALLHQRFSGAMRVSQPEPNAGMRTVWFDGGMPVFTDWFEPTDVLGQILLEHGVIGQGQLVTALEAMANQGGLLGEHLLKQGMIEPGALQEGLRKQCFRKLVHLFSLRDGEVTVMATEQDTSQLAKVNVLELIGIGVGAHYDLTRIETELGAGLRGAVRATAALERYRTHFRFRPTDTELLAALSTGTTFEGLVAGGAPALRVGQLIYMLWACQMLRVGAAAHAESVPSAVPRPTATAPSRPPVAAARAPAPKPAAPAARPSPPPGPATPTASPAPAPSPPPAAKPAAPKPAAPGDEATFLGLLEAFEHKVASKTNPFELLGVQITAGRKELRGAWAELSKQLHPDGLQAKGLAHLKDRVSNVFAALSEAHGLLSDKDKREQLRDAIERGEDPTHSADAAAQARAAFESELIAKDGDKLLKAGRFEDARRKFVEALTLTPDEYDLRAAAAWCEYNLSDKQRVHATKAERTLAEIVEANPRLARAHYFRGHVLKDMGAIEAAIISFEEAQAQDTRLIDAERQARALRMSQGRSASKHPEPKAKKKGLRGFFGKG